MSSRLFLGDGGGGGGGGAVAFASGDPERIPSRLEPPNLFILGSFHTWNHYPKVPRTHIIEFLSPNTIDITLKPYYLGPWTLRVIVTAMHTESYDEDLECKCLST